MSVPVKRTGPQSVTVKAQEPRENLKKSKLFCESKKEQWQSHETLYHRLDLDTSTACEAVKPAVDIQLGRVTDPGLRNIYQEMGNILQDPIRRVMYDTMRVTGQHKTSGYPGVTHHTPGMHHVIKTCVGEPNLKVHPEIWSRSPKSKDVNHVLKCSLEEFYNGKNIKLKIQRQVPCEVCKGLRLVQNAALVGSGGQAYITCQQCMGKGVERKPNMLEFQLIPGVRNGFRKRLKGQGDMPPKHIPSDIYLIAEQKMHPTYIRAGSDLIVQLELSFSEYLTGCTKYLKHLKEGANKSYKMLKLNIPPLKSKMIIIGKGMPKTQLDSQGELMNPEEKTYGNLIIEALVNYPDSIDDPSKIQRLAKLIPSADNPTLVTDPDITIDRHILQENINSIGDDLFESSQGDRDLVADGSTPCPIS